MGRTSLRAHPCRPTHRRGLRWQRLAGVVPVRPASIAPSPLTDATSAPTDAPAPVATPTVVASARPEIMLVAVGDSISFNKREDCPGCTGFVDRLPTT